MIKKISFQGKDGAYSHLAIHEVYSNAEHVPCITFEETIE